MKADIIAEKQEFGAAEQSTIKPMTPFSGEDYNNNSYTIV